MPRASFRSSHKPVSRCQWNPLPHAAKKTRHAYYYDNSCWHHFCVDHSFHLTNTSSDMIVCVCVCVCMCVCGDRAIGCGCASNGALDCRMCSFCNFIVLILKWHAGFVLFSYLTFVCKEMEVREQSSTCWTKMVLRQSTKLELYMHSLADSVPFEWFSLWVKAVFSRAANKTWKCRRKGTWRAHPSVQYTSIVAMFSKVGAGPPDMCRIEIRSLDRVKRNTKSKKKTD